MDSETIWKIIDSKFRDNYQTLVRHHIESYNHFYNEELIQIFKEKNPLILGSKFDKDLNDYREKCIMYFGGKEGNKIYYGKPCIYDDNDNFHLMYPNEARLRNMSYGMTIHYDVDIEFISIRDKISGGSEAIGGSEALYSIFGGAKKNKGNDIDMTTRETLQLKEEYNTDDNILKRTTTLKQMYLGRFPIMVQSNFCVLNGLSKTSRFNLGECNNDVGGYFIIDGKEKTLVSQEKFADNALYIQDVNDDKYLYKAVIRSISENVSKPQRSMFVGMVSPGPEYSNKNIVIYIPNVRKPIPMCIVFRALGIISDKSIIEHCLLDMDKYSNMIDLFTPSVYDAGSIMTQTTALKYIATFTKYKTTEHILEILSDYLLPHIGENNFKDKALFLGHMIFRLLRTYMGIDTPTDRDNFKYKRIELAGTLMYDLFREYYTIQLRHIHLEFEKRLMLNQSLYEDNLIGLINQFYPTIFSERSVEEGFKKGMKGNWGSQEHTKRVGAVQSLNYLTHSSMLSHLRKTNLQLDSSAKVVGPRVLHGSQWGFFDPIDTPDGGNIGIHKHMSMGSYITRGIQRNTMIEWIHENTTIETLENTFLKDLDRFTKVFVNGMWLGIVKEPTKLVDKMKLYRRNGLLPPYISVSFNIANKIINIYCDGGRICRPIFYKDGDSMSFEKKNVLDIIAKNDFTWNDLITGFNKKQIDDFNPNNYKMYSLSQLYGVTEENPNTLQKFIDNKSIIDYIDNNETDDSMIALNYDNYLANKGKYTHMEIHESLIMGVMSNLIPFPENNPATRNSFSCGQSKQASSLFHTNYQLRMDKSAIVLNNGQIPLVKSRYMKHINNEENVYGENAIVAIMAYTSYNVEDAVLINEGSLERGLFRTTYFTTYEVHEEKSIVNGDTIIKSITNIENDNSIIGLKPGYDYSKLDEYGVIREGSVINEKTILIGMASSNSLQPDSKMDMSKGTKKGQLGVVDKVFITEGEEGQRICKVRVREVRIPNIGDKFASRAGQKGTVGLVIREEDMPFTRDGLKPDIIVNPHAIPSRMTIGQLVETITGKVGAMNGGFIDCTSFINEGSKIDVFGKMLNKSGFHSSGNEILYNGFDGSQLESHIFIGPTYYLRLKHMVKDKINFRSLGPRNVLTRQAVSGRANDGGLRIGEMERDGVISHGASAFLQDSMMTRGDKYKIAICNNSGLLSIYNEDKNIFYSPALDGPIHFVGSTTNNDLRVEKITQNGRDFSILEVPYSFKLLLQELQTMNVQMRLITDDNIQQHENLNYSLNIQKLLNSSGDDMKDHIDELTKQLNQKILEVKANKDFIPYASPDTLGDIDEQFIKIYKKKYPSSTNETIAMAYTTFLDTGKIVDVSKFNPKTPGTPLDSPPFAPGTPLDSPPFAPGTPLDSPPFAPGTPLDSPVWAPSGTPLDSPVWAPSGTPLDSSDFISNNNSLQSPDYAIEYNIGDKVHFRSDFKQNRVWSVKNVSNKFITLETDDFAGLNENDYIKVVTTNDIYKVKELPYSDINDTPISGLKQMNVDTIDKPQPNIFAPVINIGRPIQNAEEPNINDTISSKIPSDLIKGEIQIPEPTNEEVSLNTTDLSKIGKGENVIIKKV
jgi:DNA-directed RNA polymerase II subunit RPB2